MRAMILARGPAPIAEAPLALCGCRTDLQVRREGIIPGHEVL